MNEIFKKLESENIPLEGGYFLKPDGYNGLVLIKETEKSRENKNKKVETYTHIEKIYLPTISKTLQRYLELSLGECKDIQDIKQTLERVENQISKIKEKW